MNPQEKIFRTERDAKAWAKENNLDMTKWETTRILQKRSSCQWSFAERGSSIEHPLSVFSMSAEEQKAHKNRRR